MDGNRKDVCHSVVVFCSVSPSTKTTRNPPGGIEVAGGKPQGMDPASMSVRKSPSRDTGASPVLINSSHGSAVPLKSRRPNSLRGNTSLMRSVGNSGKTAETVLAAPGVADRDTPPSNVISNPNTMSELERLA